MWLEFVNLVKWRIKIFIFFYYWYMALATNYFFNDIITIKISKMFKNYKWLLCRCKYIVHFIKIPIAYFYSSWLEGNLACRIEILAKFCIFRILGCLSRRNCHERLHNLIDFFFHLNSSINKKTLIVYCRKWITSAITTSIVNYNLIFIRNIKNMFSKVEYFSLAQTVTM